MRGLLDRLKEGDTLIADGAIGTLLLERGLRPGGCPESMTLDQPSTIAEIAEGYLGAGADIVTTNTFGASPLKLGPYGLADRVEEINATAVSLVRDRARDRAYVAGSVGPCGKLISPYGEATVDEVYEGFQRQAGSLVSAGVDLILIETMIDLTEAKLAVKASRVAAAAIPVVASMTFDRTPHGYYTIMGASIEQAATELAESGADVVGSNCGNGIEQMVEIARAFRRVTDMPMIIQSNAGLPQATASGTVYPDSPDFMAKKSLEFVELEVSIVGGCCGTTPAHIAAIGRAMRSSIGSAGRE